MQELQGWYILKVLQISLASISGSTNQTKIQKGTMEVSIGSQSIQGKVKHGRLGNMLAVVAFNQKYA